MFQPQANELPLGLDPNGVELETDAYLVLPRQPSTTATAGSSGAGDSSENSKDRASKRSRARVLREIGEKPNNLYQELINCITLLAKSLLDNVRSSNNIIGDLDVARFDSLAEQFKKIIPRRHSLRDFFYAWRWVFLLRNGKSCNQEEFQQFLNLPGMLDFLRNAMENIETCNPLPTKLQDMKDKCTGNQWEEVKKAVFNLLVPVPVPKAKSFNPPCLQYPFDIVERRCGLFQDGFTAHKPKNKQKAADKATDSSPYKKKCLQTSTNNTPAKRGERGYNLYAVLWCFRVTYADMLHCLNISSEIDVDTRACLREAKALLWPLDDIEADMHTFVENLTQEEPEKRELIFHQLDAIFEHSPIDIRIDYKHRAQEFEKLMKTDFNAISALLKIQKWMTDHSAELKTQNLCGELKTYVNFYIEGLDSLQ